LLIGEWRQGKIEIVERLSEKVQLGENVRQTGRISPTAFERGLACLRRFSYLMAQYPLQQYWALGTNTFRVTENADAFIASAGEIGIDISVISGVQEAVLIYAGVITELPSSDVHRLVIDIGGGSTEVIIGSHHQRLLTDSLPIGSVAWRDHFFRDVNPDTESILAAMDAGRQAAIEVFAAVAPGVARCGWQQAHASSGTVKMLAAICQGQGSPAGIVSLDALRELKTLLAETIVAQGELEGLKEARRDLLLPGWCVLSGLMEAYRVPSVQFSATALREGMLDFMVRNEKTLDSMTQSDLPSISSATSG
jgi:exopolyphosphatase/guanosine-5'-triphosphate,3'-diphosphate pyrophosphatase